MDDQLRDGAVAIRTALTEPQLTMGMPRTYLVMVWTMTVAFGFGAGNWWAWPIGGVLHILGRVATYYDDQFVEVLIRHMHLKAHYYAHTTYKEWRWLPAGRRSQNTRIFSRGAC